MRLTKKWFSPLVLFVSTWTFAHIAAYFGPKQEVYDIYNVNITFTFEGFIWVLTATVVFILGIYVANRKQIRFQLSLSRSIILRPTFKLSSLTLLTFYLVGIGLVLLLLYWTGLAVREVGSIFDFIQLTYQEWHAVRQIWPNQKPFTGGRLLYTGLICIVLFGATGIAEITKHEYTNKLKKFQSYLIWSALILTGLVPLMILPIIVSQRILLATALVGAVTVFGVRSRFGIPIKYPLGGLVSGIGVWTAQETVRVGLSTGGLIGSLEYGVTRIFFYFSNDIGNLHRGVTFVSERSYGFETFSFVFEYLFISQTVKQKYLDTFYSAAEPHLAGGGFTALGIPYLDFGIFGLIIIFVWGYISQSAYLCASDNIFATQVYGLLAASIVLSWHALIWSNPFFWLNTGILLLIPIAVSVSQKCFANITYEQKQGDS